jgi:uncharacterized membrane protein YdjX (TVP38/TMEM64 family)
MSGKSHTASHHHAATHHAAHHHAAHRGDHHFRLNWRYAVLGLLVVSAVVALFVFTELEWRQVPAMLEQVSRPWAIVIMSTAPLVGFPISAVYLAAGALFGPALGLLVVTGVTAVHLGLTHLLAATVLREPIERLRKKWIRKIPEVPPDEHATLVAMIVLVPGLPYFARNGLLALSKVPWHLLLIVGLPLYVIRSCATIFLGDLGNDPSIGALAVLGGIYVIKLGATVLLFQRLRHSLQRKKQRRAHHAHPH